MIVVLGCLLISYGVEVSPTLISSVTDAVLEEVKIWQTSPLEEIYPIVYLDALMVKMRDNGHITVCCGREINVDGAFRSRFKRMVCQQDPFLRLR
jgi:hypothetical protein